MENDTRGWPYFAQQMWLRLNEILATVRRLGSGGSGGDERIARIEQKLDVVIDEVRAFRREDREGDERMSKETQAAIDELTVEVGENTNATESVVTVVDNLVDQLEGAADDPAQIRAIAASLRSNRAAIAAAVLKGTPAAPTPSGM